MSQNSSRSHLSKEPEIIEVVNETLDPKSKPVYDPQSVQQDPPTGLYDFHGVVQDRKDPYVGEGIEMQDQAVID